MRGEDSECFEKRWRLGMLYAHYKERKAVVKAFRRKCCAEVCSPKAVGAQINEE
jgi:hypothetical protein